MTYQRKADKLRPYLPATRKAECTTHECFIMAIAKAAIARLPAEDRARFADMKLTYGYGLPGVRGITYYGRWKGQGKDEAGAFVEIGAGCQEDWVQVAGTTIHELAHVLAGWGAGHGKEWKAACGRLGLRRVHAAGTKYRLANFEGDLRMVLVTTPKPDDGEPVCNLLGVGGKPATLKPCTAGIGTRGGQSRGAGSGSRLRLFECECVPPVKARVARDTFAATCDCCSGPFHLVVKA